MISQLNQIDIKDLYKQSATIRYSVAVLLFLMIVGISSIFLLLPEYEQWQIAKQQETQLKTQYHQKSAQLQNIAYLQQELQHLQASFEQLLHQLPEQTNIASLIDELSNIAHNSGVEIIQITPQAAVAEHSLSRLPFQLSISGSFESLQQFTRQLGQQARIINLSNLSIKPNENHSEILQLTATLNTYQSSSPPLTDNQAINTTDTDEESE